MDKQDTILITGVAGLIGWNFANYLLQETQHKVIGVDALEDWGNNNMIEPQERYKFYRIYLGEQDPLHKLDKIVEENDVKCIYHFASYAAEGLSPFIRHFNYIQNTLATAQVINTCIKYDCKLIYTSSMAVYGKGVCVDPTKTFDENDQPSPIDPYGIAKYGCELDIKVAGEQHGMDWVIIRPHNVFGIGQNVNDRYRNVLGIWMHQAFIKEPMTIYGDGNQERAFTFIDNILEPLYKSANLSHEIINIGGIQGTSINHVCQVIAKITNWDNIVYLEPRHEVKRAIPNPSKSIKILDYEDKISFEEGVTRMWNWVVDSQRVKEWYVWNNFELDKGIYKYWK